MVHENGTTDHPLILELLKEGHRFSFFQAVRLLHLGPGNRPRLGHQGPAGEEAIRLRPVLDLSFAVSEVAQVRRIEDPEGRERFEVFTTFLSLYGASSPLPTYFTEELLNQEGDSVERAFLDQFHHRLLSLFYRAWEKYRIAVQYRSGGTDPLSRRLQILLGLDRDRLPANHRVPAARFIGFGGLISQLPRSGASVCSLLSDHFEGIDVAIEPLVGRWVDIPRDQRNGLGVRNCRLGEDLTLGDRVFDRAGAFRVGLGPMGWEDFQSFLPGGGKIDELRELVDLVNTDMLNYDVELRLRTDHVPDLRLSEQGARLGWSTWLGTSSGADASVRIQVKGWLHGGS